MRAVEVSDTFLRRPGQQHLGHARHAQELAPTAARFCHAVRAEKKCVTTLKR